VTLTPPVNTTGGPSPNGRGEYEIGLDEDVYRELSRLLAADPTMTVAQAIAVLCKQAIVAYAEGEHEDDF